MAHSLWLGVGSSLDPPKDWAGCQEDIEGVVAEECLSHGVCEKPAPEHSHRQAAFQPVPVGPALLAFHFVDWRLSP